MRHYFRKIIFSTFFLPVLFPAQGQEIAIGLFEGSGLQTFVFHCTGNGYTIKADSGFSRNIRAGELYYISLMNEQLVMLDGQLNHGSFDEIHFIPADHSSTFRLKAVEPSINPRDYTGSLTVSRFHGTIQLINRMNLDDYLAGVVESESGPGAEPEFYKAQAILCRSYTLRNWDKHPGQGFNLCDNTHCQAFKGISNRNPLIHEAVLGTHGLVICDDKSNIIAAAYHSNSGGETQRASDVWNSDEIYLQAVVDPFSEGQRNAIWEKTISREEWIAFLRTRITADLTKLSDDQLLIKQDHRKKYFIIEKDTIRITDIRAELELRSTFFSMEASGDKVLFRGKGYGHGVGMSQEGAMEMARQGYSGQDILRFYYFNVRIMEVSELPESSVPEGF